MGDDELERRRNLTFAQAEGVAPLPAQLKPKELTKELRSLIWAMIFETIETEPYGRSYVLSGDWLHVMKHYHVLETHLPINDFNKSFDAQVDVIKSIIYDQNYIGVFRFLQFVMRHPHCPEGFPSAIEGALSLARAAYYVFAEDTIVPKSSDTEAETVRRAYDDLASAKLQGAMAHLRASAEACTAGRFADSARESIHAVESVARQLAGDARTLEPALSVLKSKGVLHQALKNGSRRSTASPATKKASATLCSMQATLRSTRLMHYSCSALAPLSCRT